MNCCANLSNLVIYRALLSDPIVNALRRPKEFFAPELEGLLLVADGAAVRCISANLSTSLPDFTPQ